MWLDALGVGLGNVTLGVAEPLGAGGEPVSKVAVAADGVGLDAACRSWAEQPRTVVYGIQTALNGISTACWY